MYCHGKIILEVVDWCAGQSGDNLGQEIVILSLLDVWCTLSDMHRALREADVILLLGARLNWILHFGRPPRFKPDVKIIQVGYVIEIHLLPRIVQLDLEWCSARTFSKRLHIP